MPSPQNDTDITRRYVKSTQLVLPRPEGSTESPLGTVNGMARIDDHAVIVSGTVSDTALVNALSVVSGITVSNSAHVGTVFQGPGTFETGQTVSGTGQILGDIELRGQGFNVTSGVYYGFVDNTVTVDTTQGSARTAPVPEVTAAGPYVWRP
jgi:hypothetical protein